jgi:Kelch motif
MRIRSFRWLARATPLLATVAVLSGGAVARAEGGVGSWSPTGSMLEGWHERSAVTLADGQVLAVGGGEQSTTEIYDPSSGTWTKGPELQAQGNEWTLVALAEGGALMIGETPCSAPKRWCLPTTSTYRLNPSDSEWSPAAPMHETRVRPLAVRLADGRVLVAGGFGDECTETIADGYSCQPLASAEIYNPVSNEWSPSAPMPQARGGDSAVLLSDGTVLAVGGETQDSIRYSPASDTWSMAAPTASRRTGSLLIALPGDRALTVGSQSEAGFFGSLGGAAERAELLCKPVSSEIFDAATNVWIAPLTASGRENCVYPQGTLLSGGQVLLGGDLTYHGVSGSYDVLDTEQRCWSTTPPPLEERNEGAVVALSGDRALVFGGQGPSGQWLSSAEIYTPGLPTCFVPTTPVDPPPAVAPPDPRFTGATIVHRRRFRVTSTGLIRLLVRCPSIAAGRCIGRVQLALLVATSTKATTKNHAKHVLLGAASFSIAAGKSTYVTMHVTRHKRMLHSVVRRWRRATVVLTTTDHDDIGQVATTVTSGTLH